MKVLISFLLTCIVATSLHAQTPRRAARYSSGFLPYTGVHYFKKGIDYVDIELTQEDRIWVNNKLPQGQTITLDIRYLSGFKVSPEGHIHPIMWVKLIDLNTGEVLSQEECRAEENSPIMKDTPFSVSYALMAKDMPVGPYRWVITVEDQASDHRLELKADVDVVDAEEPLLTAEYSQDIGFIDLMMDIYYTGVGMDWVTSAVSDHNPVSSQRYQRTLILPNVTYLTEEEFLKGKTLIGVYDHLGQRVKDADAHIKKRKITIDTQPGPDLRVDIKAFIEFKDDTKDPMHYSIRFYWVSEDGHKAFDVFVK